MLTEFQADMVVLMLSRAMKCSLDDLRGPDQSQQFTGCRCRASRFLRDCGMSLPAIGIAMNRCHTTILYRLRMAAEYPPVILPADEAELVTAWVTANGGKPLATVEDAA